ncbi:aldo/keto reductase [Lactobacillus sp. W8089]|nr:aldo/keto reductase [Lactobacillus sp. W8086]MBI0108665.1 aldo/keto reductase [Lactobacillus sp. W8085]MBI0111882.1 aldo/keto reductase [Lactobacillus sp. W8088]MBI0115598.1 aldo/keto reductase [Lactobacillus sp. W8087]MBI0119322.1 aldo/keto reductase [Lactobacillus sp. W8089]MBI0131288.1 aldo/keto reductase [Lactobacillus sp. W8090]
MEKVRIGKSDVYTIKLGLGTNKVGGHNLFKNLNEKDGYDLVREALNQGINFLDTAYVYGIGRSEKIIGDVLQDYDRSKVIIATKAAQDKSQDMAMNNSADFIKKSVDEALLRLKTDYIDIFYLHFPDEKTPKDEAVETLDEIRKAGKIRAIGVSNFSLDQIKEANANGKVDIVEDQYSLVHRSAVKEELEYLQAQNISFVPYFPLASGLLTGKYSLDDWDKFKNTDGGQLLGDFSKEQYDKAIQGIEGIRKIADSHQATVTQTVLAWYMANPAISVVIPGARNVEQVKNNAAALHIELSPAEYQQIDQLFSDF